MPLSWGRRYCVYKYQGFLFYIVTLVLSNVHAFRIGSFLSLPRFSQYCRYRLYPMFSLEYRYGSSHRSRPRRLVPPRKPPGIHVRSPGLGSLGETTVGDQCDGLYQLRIGGDRFCRIKHFWHSTSFRSFITDKYRFSRMDFLL